MSPRPRGVLDRLVDTSVHFNGLMIPASTLQTTLSRYVDNLVLCDVLEMAQWGHSLLVAHLC